MFLNSDTHFHHCIHTIHGVMVQVLNATAICLTFAVFLFGLVVSQERFSFDQFETDWLKMTIRWVKIRPVFKGIIQEKVLCYVFIDSVFVFLRTLAFLLIHHDNSCIMKVHGAFIKTGCKARKLVENKWLNWGSKSAPRNLEVVFTTRSVALQKGCEGTVGSRRSPRNFDM